MVLPQLKIMTNPTSTPAGSIYVDCQFFDNKAAELLDYYREEYPEKKLKLVSLSRLLDFLASYLKLSGRFDVHLFGTSGSFKPDLVFPQAPTFGNTHDVSFNVVKHQHHHRSIATELVKDLHKSSTHYEQLVLLADDDQYPSLLSHGPTFDVLLRQDNDCTSMAELEARSWQDIDYVIGYCMGLETHEL